MTDPLDEFIKQHIQEIKGANFKVAVYLYWRLREEPELTITTKELAEKTGQHIGSTQSASNRLAKQGILKVTGGPGVTKTYRLPAAKARKAKPGRTKTMSIAARQADRALASKTGKAKPKGKRVVPAAQPEQWPMLDVIDQCKREP